MESTRSERNRLLTILAYMAVYIGWGTTYLAIRIGIESWGLAEFMGLRFLISATALAPILLLRRGLWRGAERPTLQQIAHSSLIGVLILVGGLLPVAYAEKTLPSNIAAIVVGCAPIEFAILDRLIFGTPIRKEVVFGFFLGLAGIILLGQERAGPESAGVVTASGLALVIGGSCSWSFGSVFSRKLKPVPRALEHVFVQYLAAGAVYLGVAAAFEGANPSRFLARLLTASSRGWASLLYIALFPSLLSYTSYMWLLKREPSARVSTYAFVNPVVAVIAGALVLGERATPSVLGALGLVLAGTWLNFRKPKPVLTAPAGTGSISHS